MHIRSTPFKLILGLVGAIILTAGMSTLVNNQLGAHGGDSRLIHACVHDRIGVVKIATPDESCPSGWTALDWNFRGRPGTSGTAGPPGPQGQTGEPGAAGSAGLAGNQGQSGSDGGAGPTGPAGVSGPAGPAGPQGSEGPAGASEWMDGSSRVTTLVNVGIGTANPQEKFHTVGNVRVDGSLIANNLLYTTPRTNYFVVGGEGFLPGQDSGYNNSFGKGGAYLTDVGLSGAMAAPVNLPHGAIVKSVVARFYDNSSSDMTLNLSCNMATGSYLNYASLTSEAISGYGDDTASLNQTIDNSGPCSYHLRAFSTSWDGTELRIHRVVISYTLGEAP